MGGAFIVAAVIIVADSLELGSKLALSFFGGLDLGTLSGESDFFFRGILFGCCTALLLFGPLQLACFDLFFEGTKRCLLLFTLLLQLALLPRFFVSAKWSVLVNSGW